MVARILEGIRALAQTGLNYSSELPYHRALYQQILQLCVNPKAAQTEVDTSEQWQRLVSELGVITPKVGSVVTITNADGAVLLLQRPTGLWCLPCGYADIGETPEATAIREAFEETGLEINLRYLLGVATTSNDTALPFMWEVIYIAEIESGTLRLSHEHLSAEWVKTIDERPWHSTHRAHVERSLAFLHHPHEFSAIATNSSGA